MNITKEKAMPRANQKPFNRHSMSIQSRNKSYGVINILWNKMRPDLRFEDKEMIREERLAWIAEFLGLNKLESTKSLTDAQIGRVLDEMKRLTGQPVKTRQNATMPQPPTHSGILGVVQTSASGEAEILHLTTPEQLFTLEILEAHIGWTVQQRENYLKPRFNRTSFQTLKVAQANSLTMQLLTIAAQKDLKSILGPNVKISRQQISKYIPTLKKQLGIDQKETR
jgi:hypothetical protein